MCPECGSTEITVEDFDFGVCPETGYHNAGERFRCRACGATGNADDLMSEVDSNLISLGSSERPRRGG